MPSAEMEPWLCQEDVQLIKLLKILKRNTWQESGYESDESDMVTGSCSQTGRYQTPQLRVDLGLDLDLGLDTRSSPCSADDTRLSAESAETSEDSISFLDISNFLSRCCIDSTWCTHSTSSSRHYSDNSRCSTADSAESPKLRLEPQKYEHDRHDQSTRKRENPSCDRMSDKPSTSTSTSADQVAAKVCDELVGPFQSSSTRELHLETESSANKGDSKEAQPSARASKKDEAVEEKPVMVPTGRPE